LLAAFDPTAKRIMGLTDRSLWYKHPREFDIHALRNR
jgi:hypothetical protein